MDTRWRVRHLVGDPGSVHSLSVDDDTGPEVWIVEIDTPALVLGSAQPDHHVDRTVCADRGIDVVRRRSGGGAVLLLPGEVTWIDVVVPVGHPLWHDDVVRAAWWLGDTWSTALGRTGLDGTAVHRGPLVSGPWSRHVCFAGVGPGEVTSGDRKVVGISQRRTRRHARFQCVVHHVWRPDLIAALFSSPGPPVSDLVDAAAVIDAQPGDLAAALVDELAIGGA